MWVVISPKVEVRGQAAFEIDLCQPMSFPLSKVKCCNLKLKCIQLDPLILCHEVVISLYCGL